MAYNPTNPMIVQGDKSVLLEVNNERYEAARDELARFAELEKSPEHIHTYKITPLSLWNAAAAGMSAAAMIDALVEYGKFDLPGNVRADILDYVGRYGRLKLYREDNQLVLRAEDRTLIIELQHNQRLTPYFIAKADDYTLIVKPHQRGAIKQALIKFGYPIEDLAGYVSGAALQLRLREFTLGGEMFELRQYQEQAADAFWAGGSAHGGSGVIVLPCGAGKTIVGLNCVNLAQAQTLILTTNTVAVRQWKHELVDKTTLHPEDIAEYSGDRKEIGPVTITTYQMITWRPQRSDPVTGDEGIFPHFEIFNQRDWGLIVYDEVHLLPAPVFRVTADLQARRRLGLTATLVREDGRETDVFTLIGPKKFDVPWRDLERQGWIATAECHEIRVAMPERVRLEYAVAENRNRYRIAAENPVKTDIATELVRRHRDDHVLIIGQYIDQITALANHFDAPLITGKMPNWEREKLYEQFRRGEIKVLVVSKVANFAIDLPDANVAIQVSGAFGSRQEEAQRLGRILRPKKDGSQANFYTIVSRDTVDQEFAQKRQMFLTEQGYKYTILAADETGALIDELSGYTVADD